MINENNIPEIVTINQFCDLMGITRSRFYQILSQGLILAPTYSDSKRPYYSKEMVLKNLKVRKDNIGINGKICLFYNTKKSTTKDLKIKIRKSNSKTAVSEECKDIIAGLAALNLTNVKASDVEAAIKKSFPDGTENISEGDILRTIFLAIKAGKINNEQ